MEILNININVKPIPFTENAFAITKDELVQYVHKLKESLLVELRKELEDKNTILDSKQLAERFNVTAETIADWRRRGFVRIKGEREDIKFIHSRKVQMTLHEVKRIEAKKNQIL